MAIAPGPYLQLIVRLAHRRHDLGLSQVELGRQLGVAEGLVSTWECGNRHPSPFMLVIWAEGLGCDLMIRAKPEAKPVRAERWRQLEFDFDAPLPKKPKRRKRRKGKKPKKGRKRRKAKRRRGSKRRRHAPTPNCALSRVSS